MSIILSPCVGDKLPKNRKFDQILKFGAPVPTSYTYQGQIWRAWVDHLYTLPYQISSRLVHRVGLEGQHP